LKVVTRNTTTGRSKRGRAKQAHVLARHVPRCAFLNLLKLTPDRVV
jgi:hypothetical protein